MEKVLASSTNVTKLRAFVSIGHGRLTGVGEGRGVRDPRRAPITPESWKRQSTLTVGSGVSGYY